MALAGGRKPQISLRSGVVSSGSSGRPQHPHSLKDFGMTSKSISADGRSLRMRGKSLSWPPSTKLSTKQSSSFLDGDRSGVIERELRGIRGWATLKPIGNALVPHAGGSLRSILTALRAVFLSFSEAGGDSHPLGEKSGSPRHLPVSWVAPPRPSAESCAVIPSPTHNVRWPSGHNATWHA